MGRKELAVILRGCETFTPRRLPKYYPELEAWSESAIALSVAELETLGAVSPIGEKRAHFAVNHERLEELIAADEAEAAQQAADPNSPETPAAPADAQANKEGEAPKPKLVNKLPTKKSALDDILARINKIPKAAVYEGDALEAKLNEVVSGLVDLVGHVNEGIIALSERAPDIVDSATDLISLRRVMPEKAGGVGGVVAEYSPDGGHSKKVLFQRVWAKAPTDAWFRHLSRDLEAECVHMLGRMAKYVEKHNKQR